MNTPVLRRALAVLLVALLALPALASAATPENGRFTGPEGVSFVVGRSPHGSPLVHEMQFQTHYSGSPRTISNFQQAFPHDGSFETCGRYGHTQVMFWEYCVVGHFGSPGHASGVVHAYHGFRGLVASKPFETRNWSATLQ